MIRKYGLITYEGVVYPGTNKINLGDYVQSIAARQFLPTVDEFVSREKLDKYDRSSIKIIMNAWYMANPQNFPPSLKIEPLYISVHLNSSIIDNFFTKKTVEYLKGYAPIGCRDIYTREILLSKGIDAYFSGCLTLTLGHTYKRTVPNENIYIIDVMYDSLSINELLKKPFRLLKRIFTGRIKECSWRNRILNKYFTKELLDSANYLTQIVDDVSVLKGFEQAEEYLKKLCDAKLVITSRIHCALPCLAMGVPVIFINGGFSVSQENCRFDGLSDFFNRIDVDSNGKSSLNFEIDGKIGTRTVLSNKNSHEEYAQRLTEKCEKFIRK